MRSRTTIKPSGSIRETPRAFDDRGKAYSKLIEYDRAIQDYDQAIKIDPNYVYAFVNRGIMYAKKKQYDRAIQDYDQAIKLDPKDTSRLRRPWQRLHV